MKLIDVGNLRSGLREALDLLDQAKSRPDCLPAFTYILPSQAWALDPEVTLVEGVRGAGKTFWWTQLISPAVRQLVQEVFFDTPQQLRIERGFGTDLAPDKAPSTGVLAELVSTYQPRSIWRAVVAFHAGFEGEFAQLKQWSERVHWIDTHAETYDTLLAIADIQLGLQGQTLLILFDAFDRMADDWEHLNPLAKALLQVAQEARSTRRIRCKVFVRPDILKNPNIIGFPDYAKLLGGKASLQWQRANLYALLFQCLANSSSGGWDFRNLVFETCGLTVNQGGSFWAVPPALRTDEKVQEALFDQLAGSVMSSSPQRGKPYTWLINHLQDGLNQVSPLSFFTALKTAVDATDEAHAFALDYRAIQLGVKRAAQVRVQEITEDYPWVDWVMEPLRGRLSLPCEVKEFEKLWSDNGTLESLETSLKNSDAAVKLPPLNLSQGSSGVLMDLQSLGLMQRLKDGRIQMPDIYRRAFGFGRHGGLKPVK